MGVTLAEVINPKDDWQANKFTVRRRIFVLEKLLEEEVLASAGNRASVMLDIFDR